MTDKEIGEQLQIISEALNKIKPQGMLIVFRDAEGLIHLYGNRN